MSFLSVSIINRAQCVLPVTYNNTAESHKARITSKSGTTASSIHFPSILFLPEHRSYTHKLHFCTLFTQMSWDLVIGPEMWFMMLPAGQMNKQLSVRPRCSRRQHFHFQSISVTHLYIKTNCASHERICTRAFWPFSLLQFKLIQLIYPYTPEVTFKFKKV